MVPFAGFVMPLQYKGIIEEHRAVRRAMGMFDLSHMGELRLEGPDAVAAADYLVTNDVLGMDAGQIRYTPMCYPDGGIVDDILVYRYSDHVMLVVNAANIEKDLDWVRGHIRGDVTVTDESDNIALIAVQGPEAERFLQNLTDTSLGDIAYYHFAEGEVAGVPATISRTGYTGEDGFELYVLPGDAAMLWNALQDQGVPEGLELAGLGARDTLRLEAGYMLYGNDIDHSTSPLEAGLGWTVKFGDSDFVGRTFLEDQKANGVPRRMVAVEMEGRAIPRPHYPIFHEGETVGELTSGTFSPTFERGVGLGYVRAGGPKAGTPVEIDIRGKRQPAQVVKKPIYKPERG